MELKTLKEELQDLIEDNKVKAAFSFLKQELNRDSDEYDVFVTISSRFNKLHDKIRTDTIDEDKANTQSNKILTSLLEFIKELEKHDIHTIEKLSTVSTDSSTHKKVNNHIVVLIQNENPNKIQNFFNQLNFTNVQAKTIDNLEQINFNEFDLVIFDNRDLPTCFKEHNLQQLDDEKQSKILKRIEQMEYVIDTYSKFIIHYGDFLYWINDNRETVQPANSQFTLYARTTEVLEFIYTYRV